MFEIKGKVNTAICYATVDEAANGTKYLVIHSGSRNLGKQVALKALYWTEKEAPMAYKSMKDIIDVIRDSVDIIDILTPIYNFKAVE